MTEYVLRYTPQYEQDLVRKLDYITYELNNPEAANALFEAADKAILDRLDCAESFEPFHSRKNRKHLYYRIYVNNFEIFYVVREEDGIKYMELRRFLYQGEDKRKKV
jgi:hypothetical protein